MFETIKSKNKDLPLYRVTDPEFSYFGKVLSLDTAEIVKVANTVKMPETGTAYSASFPEFEVCKIHDELQNEVFGQLPIEIGFCRGHNDTMNAMEWHTCCEINIAATPLVLLLGKLYDIKDGKYDSANVKAFYLEPGQAVEVYATTLHYCPCHVEKEGFGCIVVLPEGTNLPLNAPAKDPMIRAKNKWLIAHGENTGAIKGGAVNGIYGKNHKLITE